MVHQTIIQLNLIHAHSAKGYKDQVYIYRHKYQTENILIFILRL